MSRIIAEADEQLQPFRSPAPPPSVRVTPDP
jgi:hypothetical protein